MNSNSSTEGPAAADGAGLPAHVAIIMDGNGRWAKKRLLNRIKGHEQGSRTVRDIVRASREIGISHLTLYAFSTENWRRPRQEVNALMSLLDRFLQSEQKEMLEHNIRLRVLGQVQRLPSGVRRSLEQTLEVTRNNTAMNLILALSYGGRSEIVHMVRTLAEKTRQGLLEPESITEELVAAHLYTADIPDPDLLIRTSGEMRVSNFLLWQIAYTEIFVTPTLWPDFTREEFEQILDEYQTRERRFGAV